MRSDSLRAVYRLEVGTDRIEARADALRHEQSVEVPPATVRDPFVRKEILPRVESIAPDPHGGHRVTLAFPPAITAHDPAQLLNILFGNAGMLTDVALLDVELPERLARSLGGPRHGSAGLRAQLGVPERPLTCTALKPMGLRPEALAELAGTFARAGLDVIKDDHGLADHSFCPFEERVRRCQRSIEAAADETGRRALYAPNLIGSPVTLKRQLAFALEQGVRAILVAPMLVGLPVFAELAREASDVIWLAHPAFAPVGRVAPAALYGTLFRAYGADAVIFPHAGGRFAAFDAAVCRDLTERLRRPELGLRAALPVPAGGMRVERVEELVRFYGPDVMLLVGGSLHEGEDPLLERSRGFVARVHAAGARAAEASA